MSNFRKRHKYDDLSLSICDGKKRWWHWPYSHLNLNGYNLAPMLFNVRGNCYNIDICVSIVFWKRITQCKSFFFFVFFFSTNDSLFLTKSTSSRYVT